MNPITHLVVSWGVATIPRLEARDRAFVTIAGVAADLDGLGIFAEKLTQNSETPLLWWTNYHHVLGHNVFFGLLISASALFAARKKLLTSILAFTSFHIHLLCDIVGARGPDGYEWPIHYLYPFFPLELSWSGQWGFNAWPNFVITILGLIWVFYIAAKRGYSPLELLSKKVDKTFCNTVLKWFKTNE